MDTLARLLASRVDHLKRLQAYATALPDIESRVEDELERLVKAFMPSGSGVDCGTTLVLNRSSESKLVFQASFHHMDEHGFYTGWTEHFITIDATFGSPNIKVSGQNRNGIKDYLADLYLTAIQQGVEATWDKEQKEFSFKNEHGWTA